MNAPVESSTAPPRTGARWWPALVAAMLPWLCSSPVLADEVAPRLKYRGKGSVCMCSDATDEEAIARAAETRAAAARSRSGASRGDGDKPADPQGARDPKSAAGSSGRPSHPPEPRATEPPGSPAPRSPQEQRP